MRCTLLVCALAVAAAAAAGEDELEKKINKFGINTLPKRAAAGGVAGFLGGYLIKQSQDMILNSVLLGSACVAGACYAGWVKPEELVDKAAEVSEATKGYLNMLFGSSEKPSVQLKKSKVMMSNIAKRMPGLVGGAAVGAVLGYRIG
ncbi:hypothetical protein AB1Y20_018840 [Prymnesium parvum]|uniref:Mitochondrial import inner membrane translocase subunit TIM22 n=1 Tax=Prymnesium parvum TaxID=97485 RepID=A0AB34JPL8_PRYPA